MADYHHKKARLSSTSPSIDSILVFISHPLWWLWPEQHNFASLICSSERNMLLESPSNDFDKQLLLLIWQSHWHWHWRPQVALFSGNLPIQWVIQALSSQGQQPHLGTYPNVFWTLRAFLLCFCGEQDKKALISCLDKTLCDTQLTPVGKLTTAVHEFTAADLHLANSLDVVAQRRIRGQPSYMSHEQITTRRSESSGLVLSQAVKATLQLYFKPAPSQTVRCWMNQSVPTLNTPPNVSTHRRNKNEGQTIPFRCERKTLPPGRQQHSFLWMKEEHEW